MSSFHPMRFRSDGHNGRGRHISTRHISTRPSPPPLTCMSSFHPMRFSSGHCEIATMAEAATSAAEPWMGELMAARSAWPFL